MTHSGLPPIFVAFLCSLAFTAAFLAELPVAHNLDFLPIYGQVLGMFEGVPFYSEEELYRWLQIKFPTLKVDEVPPLAQPPWYYAALFFLGFFDLHTAAKVWFALNSVLLIVAAYILTAGWHRIAQAIAIILTFVFPPVVGHLVIGQLTIPVFFAVAVISCGLTSGRNFLTAAGLFLATFKPHIGALPIAGAFLYLFFRDRHRTLKIVSQFALLLGAAITATCLIDGSWIERYPAALERVGNRPQNINCDTCISFTYAVAAFFDFSNSNKWIFGMLLFLCGVIALTLMARPRSGFSAPLVLSSAALFALLFNPYVRNYDAVLALPGFFVVENLRPHAKWRVMLAIVFAASFFMLFGRERGELHQFFWLVPLSLLILGCAARDSTRHSDLT